MPLAALKAVRAAEPGDARAEARPDGLRRFSRRHPRQSIEDGIKGPGFPVEVYNVLGAGDAFMSGFLRGWLRDEPLETCCAFANAGGAFAVSRLLCSAEYPTWAELAAFPEHGSPHRALRHDEALNHIHWATTRRAAAAVDSWRSPSTIARSSRRSPTKPARRASASAPSSCSRSRRRRKSPRAARLRHAARRQIWPRGAVSRRRP